MPGFPVPAGSVLPEFRIPKALGVSFTDALFEVGSALTTNGISMGATTVSMPIAYKWLMIAAMTVGRIEIMSVLIALFPRKTKKLTPENSAHATAQQTINGAANDT
jgi:Trk-type K+ transport system membrane component